MFCTFFLEIFGSSGWEHLTYAMSINTYSSQQLENLQLDHKEK
ncbi:transposase [Microcystis panniformis FACHB-1757]|uniref:Transposase n=1 Tax=Microcystis panniformis FACHB-1757 TaxID=1638788 RepID=A0A0K1RW84_9CHRO|nr:transposase [Microcystis panniformis FACHB-1757]